MDTGSESPGTPTTEKSGSKSSGQMSILPPLIVLPEEATTYVLKAASLTRSVKLRTQSQEKGSSDSASDMNSADEASTGPKSSKWLERDFVPKTGPRTRRIVSRVSASFRFVRRNVSTMTSRPILLIVATVLIAALFASACVLIYRLNRVHGRMSRVSQAILPIEGQPAIDVRSLMAKNEVKRLTARVRDKLHHLVDIQESITQLLDSVERASHCPGHDTGPKDTPLASDHRVDAFCSKSDQLLS
jgi:hypothetical protein